MSTARSELGILITTLVWLFIAMCFYSLLRVEFLVWNWKTWFHTLPSQELGAAFLQGLRFDLSSLTWLSSLIFLGALLPWPSIHLALKAKTLKTIFLLIHLPFLLFNAVDVEFIHFAGRRMTPDSFYLLRETHGKLGALWSTYWPLLLINLCLLGAFAFLIRRTAIDFSAQNPLVLRYKRWPLRLSSAMGVLALLTIGARGGLQIKPLNLAHATAASTDLRITHLLLNSSFTTIHSLQKKRLTRLEYFESEDQLQSVLQKPSVASTILPWPRKPKNIVLFILESFGSEYTGLDKDQKGVPPKQSFTPFLDSLKNQSIYFPRAFANGHRSIEALPSLLAGIPSLLDEPFITSSFQTNEIPQLGSELKAKGVHTSFFHGGANGTMFFQEFTQRLGFQNYFGKNEYPNPTDDDGSWGIWDGPFLQFFSAKLDGIETPFLSVFFSLSSHHPYRVPPAFENTLPSGPLPILKSVAYTDAMLREFFKTSQTKPWFKDTLFIFTADHTSKSYLPEYQDTLGSFKVPLLLYFPGETLTSEKLKLDLQEPVQHIDIYATLRELMNLPPLSSGLAHSLLQSGPREVVLYLEGQQILLDKTDLLSLPTETNEEFPDHPLLPSWKAHRQLFINALINNKL